MNGPEFTYNLMVHRFNGRQHTFMENSYGTKSEVYAAPATSGGLWDAPFQWVDDDTKKSEVIENQERAITEQLDKEYQEFLTTKQQEALRGWILSGGLAEERRDPGHGYTVDVPHRSEPD